MRTPRPSSGGRCSGDVDCTPLSVMHSSTTGTKSRPAASAIGSQHAAEETRAHARRPTRQRPDVVQVGPDGARPDAPARRPVPRDDATSLPRPEHQLTAAGAREDRRHVEVVVADVVREDLVVPEEPARGAVEDDERVGVERGAGDRRRRWARLRPAPRARVRDAGVDATRGVDRDGVPRAAAAGLRESATASRSCRTSSARDPCARSSA